MVADRGSCEEEALQLKRCTAASRTCMIALDMEAHPQNAVRQHGIRTTCYGKSNSQNLRPQGVYIDTSGAWQIVGAAI